MELWDFFIEYGTAVFGGILERGEERVWGGDDGIDGEPGL
jgi:hypothetical protein